MTGPIETVIIGLIAVFGGLAVLTLIISLFPLIFHVQQETPAAATDTEPADEFEFASDDSEEIAAVAAAAIRAFEEDACCNPLVRNA